jgi:hypothetical protein
MRVMGVIIARRALEFNSAGSREKRGRLPDLGHTRLEGEPHERNHAYLFPSSYLDRRRGGNRL